MAKISLTPLIDVVFIILVFLMLASNFQNWSTIQLNTSQSSNGSHSGGSGLLLEVTGGGWRLAGRSIDDLELADQLAAHLSGGPDAAIWLQPAAGLPVQRLVSAMDWLEAKGVKAVTILDPRPQ